MRNKDVAHLGLWLMAGTALAGLVFSQTTRQRTKQLGPTTTDRAENHIELRSYPSAIAAQVEVEGPRIEAIERGFRLLADFIFGQNIPNARIAMTAPMLQSPAAKIAMTTPVMQSGQGDKWTVQFVMPDEYTLDTLPQPTNPLIAIREIPARDVAVIRFPGSSKNNALIAGKTEQLETYLAGHGLHTSGAPIIAFYDPPWTLPFLRRNEVMVELQTNARLAEKPTLTERPIAAQKPKLAKKV